MPLQQTRDVASAANFNHILTEVPGLEDDSPVHKSLNRAGIIWDTMEDNDKALILALQNHRKAAPKSDHSSKFSVNAHHATQDAPLDAVNDVLLAMVTQHSNWAKPNSHPADTHSILSQPAKATKVQVKDDKISVNACARARAKSSLTSSSAARPKLLVTSRVLSSIEAQMEALPAATPGSVSAILIKGLTFVVSTTVRSLPLLLSRLELLCDPNGGRLLLSCINAPVIRSKKDPLTLHVNWSLLPTTSMTS